MIEPAIDQDGRILYFSYVPPLTNYEIAALRKAMAHWDSRPVVWTHNPPEVEIIQLCGRWEPDIEDTP